MSDRVICSAPDCGEPATHAALIETTEDSGTKYIGPSFVVCEAHRGEFVRLTEQHLASPEFQRRMLKLRIEPRPTRVVFEALRGPE